MPTHRQQSFLGTLWLNKRPVNTLDTLLGKEAWVNWFGGAGILPSLVSTVRNDSHMLSCQPGVRNEAMLLYFRHTPQGYRLYVREPGGHFGKGVWVYDHSYVGVAPIDQQDPSPLELKTLGGKVVTLGDLEGPAHRLQLVHAGAGLARRKQFREGFEYISTRGDKPDPWTVKILERDVPWLSNPDEL